MAINAIDALPESNYRQAMIELAELSAAPFSPATCHQWLAIKD